MWQELKYVREIYVYKYKRITGMLLVKCQRQNDFPRYFMRIRRRKKKHFYEIFTMDRWMGKVALVTGASAGIGAAIAEELAKKGLRVIGLARRIEKVEELKEKLGRIKGELVPWKGDITKQEEIARTFQWIKHKFGTIHVLVNNAGIARQEMLKGRKKFFFFFCYKLFIRYNIRMIFSIEFFIIIIIITFL